MTVNLPDVLLGPMKQAIDDLRYEGMSEFCLALIIWDIYTRQSHERTGPVLHGPRWKIESYAVDVAAKNGFAQTGGAKKPHRFTVRVPQPLYPLVLKREQEEEYRSDSAYIVSLVLFAFDPDVPQGKGVPHHKLSPLMREPKRIREGVIEQLADDFGNPDRKWPHGIETRIDQHLATQRHLDLKFK